MVSTYPKTGVEGPRPLHRFAHYEAERRACAGRLVGQQDLPLLPAPLEPLTIQPEEKRQEEDGIPGSWWNSSSWPSVFLG